MKQTIKTHSHKLNHECCSVLSSTNLSCALRTKILQSTAGRGGTGGPAGGCTGPGGWRGGSGGKSGSGSLTNGSIMECRLRIKTAQSMSKYDNRALSMQDSISLLQGKKYSVLQTLLIPVQLWKILTHNKSSATAQITDNGTSIAKIFQIPTSNLWGRTRPFCRQIWTQPK